MKNKIEEEFDSMEITVEEVNGMLLSDNPSMCYNPTNLALCEEIHKIWLGCGSNRHLCYNNCLGGGALLSTAE